MTHGSKVSKPHVVEFPRTTLSKKGGAVSTISPMLVEVPTARLACWRTFQANDLQFGSLSIVSWRSLSLYRSVFKSSGELKTFERRC